MIRCKAVWTSPMSIGCIVKGEFGFESDTNKYTVTAKNGKYFVHPTSISLCTDIKLGEEYLYNNDLVGVIDSENDELLDILQIYKAKETFMYFFKSLSGRLDIANSRLNMCMSDDSEIESFIKIFNRENTKDQGKLKFLGSVINPNIYE
jgi:hypothetical protein